MIVAALKHSSPLTRTKTADSFSNTEWTWCTALWESEDLLRVAAVSKELRAAAAADHLWEPLLERFKGQHPFGEDDHGDCTYPVYPDRIHGGEHDGHSLLLHPRDRVAHAHVPALVLSRSATPRLDEATGDVEDEFHPACDDPGTHPWINTCPTTIWLKRPPALLRCEPCVGLSFECGRSFTEHCCRWKHHQLTLPPEERLSEELWDPRWNRQDWAALTPLGRYQAIHLHVETVMAALNAPVDEAGMENMQEYADAIREEVMLRWDILDEERDDTASYCTAEAVIDTIRENMLTPDFNLFELCIANGSHTDRFFAGPPRSGWARWQPRSLGSWSSMCQVLTGLYC
ncbi:hypothetical protein FOA52_002418 [Chlamydomonas sp. UWO 241]|nr:hypothetical protein FOA52_002418 [Chlamydomonas sp. UWO 241]